MELTKTEPAAFVSGSTAPMTDILTESISSCPACGSKESKFWATGHDRLYQTTSQEYEYRQCLDCKALFQSIRPLQEEVWKCYPNQYGPHAKFPLQHTLTRLPDTLNRMANQIAENIVGIPLFRQRRNEVEKHLKKAKVMLDFGCGSGTYLDRAKKLGCKQTIGMDYSDQALEQVRSRGHKALPVDDEAWKMLGTNSIGFVRMNHVIEHLYQPDKVLNKIFSAMSPGGVLHLSTPNPVGPSATRYRSAWFALDCPRHIVLLPPERTVALLEAAGFGQIQVFYEPTTKDIVRSWAYTQVDRGLIRSDMVEGMVNDGLLNLRFSPAMIYAMRFGHGSDRYHVIAHKSK